MDDAQARHRGPPPETASSSRYPPPGQPAGEHWQHEDERSDRLPSQSRAPLDDRFFGHKSSSNAPAAAAGGYDKRRDYADWERYDRRVWSRGPDRPYGRSGGLSGGPSTSASTAATAGGGPLVHSSNNGQGPYRRFSQQQHRSRSQSPPGPSSSSALPRQRYEQQQHQQQSPPKRPWGGRDSLPPSSYTDPQAWDRDGPYRGSRGGPWSDRRPNGAAGFPSISNDSSRRDLRDARLDEPLERRPFDTNSSWSRSSKPQGYALPHAPLAPTRLTASHSSDANLWRDDKGKGPAYDDYDRRPSFSRNNQNNPPSSVINGSRGRTPESVRGRERRSPSFDEFPTRSPASSTHSSRLSDRIPPPDYNERQQQRSFTQPRLSAPPAQVHPPLNRSNSAGQPAPRRDIDLPPDRPPDTLETRLGRSASVTQGNTTRSGARGWPARRRSSSTSPTRDVEQAKTQSSPRSLAERLGPLASVTKDLQDRIEPIVFKSRTPPPLPKSPIRQSAPSTLQRNRASPPPAAPVARSFTPPLPSPARRTAQSLSDVAQTQTKGASPSPKLASSPSDAAQSSPRPSTTDLDQASSELTQARTSPDVSKDDESTKDVQEGEEHKSTTASFTSSVGNAVPHSDLSTSSDKMPRAPIPLRSAENVSAPSVLSADDSAAPSAHSRVTSEATSQELSVDAVSDEPHIAEGPTADVTTVAKLEVIEAEMHLDLEEPSQPQDNALSPTEAETSVSSIVVRDVEMDVDQQATASLDLSQEAEELNKLENQDDEAAEEDPAAKEFEKSLISFIETNEPDDEDTSVDLSTILEDNKLRAPISLPVDVNMPKDDQDLFEVKPLLLQNHDLLDGWLRETMASRDKRRGEKIFRLRQQYKAIDTEWHAHCSRLEKLRDRQKKRQNIPIAPPTPSVDSAGISIVPTTPNLLAPSGRANRRSAASSIGYGDAVRSEAEFLEILASLEDADMRDPNLRAMRTTATVPDQIIDESEYTLQQYDDNNGLVTDPFEHYNINKTPDSWTEEEIAIFCRRYALYPKQFGKIAAALPDKSTCQCVLFYYRSKKKIDFRALVDRRNRDGRRKRAKGEKGEVAGPNGKKGPSLLNNIQRARGGEAEEDEDEEPQTPGSAMAQESTVLSTARALTQQINGISESVERQEAGKRPFTARSASNKKAARFLSPSADRSGTDEGLPPPSDGAMAAAEALGFLSAIPNGDASDPASRPNSAKQKKRKPSMSENTLNTSFSEDGTPRPLNLAKRSRPHSSSYWSVADKNEFLRLLSIHGKNYVAIAEGIRSKTAVQCKNFFQNNTKKMGLNEIAARAEGDFANISGEVGLDSPTGGMEMPSVFGEPEGAALQEPPSGYFIPSHHSTKRETDDHKPFARSGGMHLRNLLDDAPDAEGGAHTHVVSDTRMQGDDDSATEDEAEPARYAQESVDARGALRQAHAERAAAQQRQASRHIQDMPVGGEAVAHHAHAADHTYYPSHMRSSSYGSRQEFAEAESYSPTYHPVHHGERGYSMPPRHGYNNTVNGHYEPAHSRNGHYSPYEGRSIYDPAHGPGYYPRPRHDEQVPAAYYRHEQHRPSYMDSPAHEKSIHRTNYPPRPHHPSPFYNGGGQSPPRHGNLPARRQSEPRIPETDATYYEHYGVPRPP